MASSQTGIVESFRAEFERSKAVLEGALNQLSDRDLSTQIHAGDNSIATICWHIAGNFQSRFTDFLTTDGEKVWRNREEEFDARAVTRPELLLKLRLGWDAVFGALAELTDQDLQRIVTIRAQPLSVHEALVRSLAHVSYHVGQVVYVAKALRGRDWKWLTIPPGGSADYNKAPAFDRPAEHARRLSSKE